MIFLSIAALLLFVILNLYFSFFFLEKFLGSRFINKYLPPSEKGIRVLYPVLLFGLTVFALLVIEYVSLQWNQRLNTIKISELKQHTSKLFDQGLYESVLEQTELISAQYDKSLKIQGVLRKVVNSSTASYYVDILYIKK